jgi:hypothetical protein
VSDLGVSDPSIAKLKQGDRYDPQYAGRHMAHLLAMSIEGEKPFFVGWANHIALRPFQYRRVQKGKK